MADRRQGAAAWRRTARIGWLAAGARHDPVARLAHEVFRQGLRVLGYAEGQNITIEHRFADRDLGRLPQLAAELVRLGPDIILAAPTPAAVEPGGRRYDPHRDDQCRRPIGLGLVASLARPGGNVTGLSYSVGLETLGKGLELLKDIIPNLRGVAILANPADPAHGLAIENVEAAAKNLGIQPHPVEVRGPGEFDSAFAAMAMERVGAIMIMPIVLSVGHADRLAELALRNQLPSMHAFGWRSKRAA